MASDAGPGPSVPSTVPPAFARLDRKLQEPLYRMAWTHLRPMQVKAIHEIFDGKGDLIVSARTASGKTEAAFLPILSNIVRAPQQSVQAVYAGPLKALINDQFLRLERLCEQAEIPVHKWHGDVGAAARKRLISEPSGVLLITPESIESMFVNHPEKLARLFGRLSFIVIDELHSFIGTERGAHLRSLIARLARKSREPVRTIGLSATLGDLAAARRWLRPREPGEVALIEGKDEKQILLKISGYVLHLARPPENTDLFEEAQPPEHHPELLADVFDAFHGKSALIFGNSKKLLEQCADFAREESKRRGVIDRFHIHHGSLSKPEREETEEALRSEPGVATFCSATLEMGIDVGNVKEIGQIGPPWSVNSLAQRLGRSGRKDGEPSVIRMFIEENEPVSGAPLPDRLFPGLLQAIAMTELMLARWCEPPQVDRLHLSTLVQQTMSVIAEQGGAKAETLFDLLVAHGGFSNVDQPTFAQVLRSMGVNDLIEQTPDGLLILGLKGEKIVRHHEFYVAFVVIEEYHVYHEGRHVGNVASAPGLGAESYLILAGRRWQVLEVDSDRKAIIVQPSEGGRVPSFRGLGGFDVNPHVRATMRALLLRDELPPYLDPGARTLLAMARRAAREARLGERAFFTEGLDVYWFTWTGSRIERTLLGLGRHCGGLDAHDEDVALHFRNTTEAQVKEVYRGFLSGCPSAEALAGQFAERACEKYEPFLADALLARNFARQWLDLEGALRLIEASCD